MVPPPNRRSVPRGVRPAAGLGRCHQNLSETVSNHGSSTALVSLDNMEAMFTRLIAIMGTISAPKEDIRLMPDLSKSIGNFDGESTSHAGEWLRSLEATSALYRWPDTVTLETARSHLTGAAREWFLNRYETLTSWELFKESFKAAFICRISLPEHWQRMKDCEQQPGESVYLYFHQKVRLCKDLHLDFKDTKKQLVIGMLSRSLISAIQTQHHQTEEDILRDIADFEEVEQERTSRAVARKKDTSRTSQPILAPRTQRAINPEKGGNTSGITKLPPSIPYKKSHTSTEPQCFNCYRSGHISRDCIEPQRPRYCVHCKTDGHTQRYCPTQTSDQENTVSIVQGNEGINPSKYLRSAQVNDIRIQAMIDPGSSSCILQASAAIKCGLIPTKSDCILTGFGGKDTKAIGKALATIEVDSVVAKDVCVLIVPDNSQAVELIIGRTWTELPSIAFAKIDDRLIITSTTSELIQQLTTLQPEQVSQKLNLRVARDTVIPGHSVNFTEIQSGSRDTELLVLEESEADSDDETRIPKSVAYGKFDIDRLDSSGKYYKSDDSESEADSGVEDSNDEREGLAFSNSEASDEDDGGRKIGKTGKSSKNKNSLMTNLETQSETQKKTHKTQIWFEKEFKFKNLENDDDEDYELDKMVKEFQKKEGNITGDTKKEIKKKVRFNDNDNNSDDDSDNSDSEKKRETDFSVKGHVTKEKVEGKYGYDVISKQPMKKEKKRELDEEGMALGTMMATSKKTKRDLLGGEWNRYAFNDDHLHVWFQDNEKKHMKKDAPVPKEMVDDYKKELEELDVRPIKKVVKAKVHKKLRAVKEMAKTKK